CARTKADIPGLASMPAAPAAGSTITYSCTLANVTSGFTNLATATGTPPIGPDVSSQDTAGVTVVQPVTHPAISIVKDPNSTTVTAQDTAHVNAKAPFVPKKPKIVSHKKPKTTG